MLAREYAIAIKETISDQATFDDEFATLILGLRKNPDYFKIMSSVTIKNREKKALLAKLAGNDLLNVLYVLIDNNRFYLISDIYDEYLKLIDQDANIMRVNLFSAKELTDKEITLIKNKLEKEYNKKIKINKNIDKTLLSGIRLEFAGKLLDSTILNSLLKMKHTLTKEASNGEY